MKYPKTIENLIECFQKFPTIGKKTAERLALSAVELSGDVRNLLIESLVNIDIKIKKCSICNNYTEKDICAICNDKTRNCKLLCIVENIKDINLIEKNNIFDGYYYVLNKLISPSRGFDISDIDFDKLESIIKTRNVEEVILAIKPSIDGEATSLYISRLLDDEKCTVSKLALGIPMGADIDYVDSLTLEMALENRKIIKGKSN